MPYRIATATGYLLSAGGSLALLVYLNLVAIPRCRDLETLGSRTGMCGVSTPVIFLFNTIFLILIALCAYRLITGFPRREEADAGELSDTFPGDAAARICGRVD